MSMIIIENYTRWNYKSNFVWYDLTRNRKLYKEASSQPTKRAPSHHSLYLFLTSNIRHAIDPFFTPKEKTYQWKRRAEDKEAHQPISALLTLSTIWSLTTILDNWRLQFSSRRNLYTSHSRSAAECLPISAYQARQNSWLFSYWIMERVRDTNILFAYN